MFSKFSVKKPMTVIVAVLLVIILGVISFTSITTDMLPSMDLPYVAVITTYPGASPEKVEQAVTKPLEQTLSTTGGVEAVTSVSSENMSMVILQFTQGTNMDSAMIEMSGSVDRVKAMLDDAVGTPTLMKINPDMLPVMVASVDIDGKTAYETSRVVQDTVIPALERVEGVASVTATGLVEEKLQITLNQEKIDALNKKILASIDESLAKLQTDYIDLLLIHQPFNDYYGTWRAMEEAYKAGKLRAIGVSNFRPHHLKALLETEVAPMVNQIEFHPGCQQRETLAFCRDHGILVEAWSPLGRGRVLDHPVLTAIAQNHGKTPAQICLRWCLEQGVLPLPKSVTPARMAENGDLFTFALTPEDMAQIAALPPFGGSGHDPDQLDF